jgi:uncharacterized protein YjbI with pentapeptide repeats
MHLMVTAKELLEKYRSGERDFAGIEMPDESSLRGKDLNGVTFKNCWVSGIDFREANLNNARFENSNVKISDFRRADLRNATFRDCTLCGVLLKGAALEGATVNNCTYYGANVPAIQDLKDTDL